MGQVNAVSPLFSAFTPGVSERVSVMSAISVAAGPVLKSATWLTALDGQPPGGEVSVALPPAPAPVPGTARGGRQGYRNLAAGWLAVEGS